ncbi:hypothetical protein BDV06DRAFT_229297 [Aspergillus oleicola]
MTSPPPELPLDVDNAPEPTVDAPSPPTAYPETPRRKRRREERERKRKEKQKVTTTTQTNNEEPNDEVDGNTNPDIDQSTPLMANGTNEPLVNPRRTLAAAKRKRRVREPRNTTDDTRDEDDDGSGILCRMPCLRCAKSSWKPDENDEPCGPQTCRRPHPGQKCYRCTRLGKTCDLVPGPFEQEIFKLRENPGSDVDLVQANRDWTRRVETFLRKANKEPVINQLLRSLLHHTFELRNEFRRAHRYADPLPPSAEMVWPTMDGLETEDADGNGPEGTSGQSASSQRQSRAASREVDDYGVSLYR